MRAPRLSARFVLRAIALFSFVVAVLWFAASPGFEPLSAVLAGFAALIPSFFVKEEASAPDQAARNRATMLDKVEAAWVKGVLESSLQGVVMLELGKEYCPEAVKHPPSVARESPDVRRAIPSGKPMIEIFDENGGELLILGTPGSGKTTMLLELARSLIVRARENATYSMPVVFNLSSWAVKGKPLSEWLVDELNTQYEVPRKVGEAWIAEDAILPLLDGLDEVKGDTRNTCVGAINTFRRDHLVKMVVCSRAEEYGVLENKLALPGAVLLKPLSPEQVEHYLTMAELKNVLGLLDDDPTLRELTETPLFLSIMSMAYRELLLTEVATLRTMEARRKHLFDNYLRQMFQRKIQDKDKLSSDTETQCWLAWLAARMAERKQTLFLIEKMQPDLLPQKLRRRCNWFFRLANGLIFGLIFGLVGGLVGGRAFGLVVWLGFGLVAGLIDRLADQSKLIKTLNWMWSAFRQWKFVLAFGLSIGLALGLAFGLEFGLKEGLKGGLLVWMLGMMVNMGIGTGTSPDRGIRPSWRNGVIGALVFGLAFGLVYGLILASAFGPEFGLAFGLAMGMTFGLAVGLAQYGGLSAIQYVILHLLLYLAGYVPLNYARFLDYCAEQLFLRKVGRGYIFIHRLLLEYFADLEPNTDKTECPDSSPRHLFSLLRRG